MNLPEPWTSSGAQATYWDHRHAQHTPVWSLEPNSVAAAALADLPPGRALDVATGEGRMALWLARRGWAVRALDLSTTGLDKARQLARGEGLHIEFAQADVSASSLGDAEYDLVLVLYLHLPSPQLRAVLASAAGAVAPGGTLLVLGHDRDNLERGVGGPQEKDALYDRALLRDASQGLQVRRLEQLERAVGPQTAIDTLLVATR